MRGDEISESKSYHIIDRRISDTSPITTVNLDILPNYTVPAPQANSLSLILITARFVIEHSKKDYSYSEIRDEWLSEIGYDERQWSYYTRAAIWLRIIQLEDRKRFSVGEMGQLILSANSHSKRQEAFSNLKRLILNDPVFSRIQSCMDANFSRAEILQETIESIQANTETWNPTKPKEPLADSTAKRRAQPAISFMRHFSPDSLTYDDRPFLKWAGGKKRVIPHILKEIRMFEMFLIFFQVFL